MRVGLLFPCMIEMDRALHELVTGVGHGKVKMLHIFIHLTMIDEYGVWFSYCQSWSTYSRKKPTMG